MQGERNRVQVIMVKNNTAFGKDKWSLMIRTYSIQMR